MYGIHTKRAELVNIFKCFIQVPSLKNDRMLPPENPLLSHINTARNRIYCC